MRQTASARPKPLLQEHLAAVPDLLMLYFSEKILLLYMQDAAMQSTRYIVSKGIQLTQLPEMTYLQHCHSTMQVRYPTLAVMPSTWRHMHGC